MIIAVSLTILIVITIFSVILGGNFEGKFLEIGVDGNVKVDGVSGTFAIAPEFVLFNIDALTFGLGIIITVATVGVIVGIQFLASGLSPESVRTLIIAVAHTGLWLVLSVLASPLIFGIEVFGELIYVVLTIGYVIGVIQKISGGNG